MADFIFRSISKVKKGGLSYQYQDWMENAHFPDMHKTNCFEGETIKQIDSMSDDDFDIICYTHQVKGPSEWKTYNDTENFRPKLKKDYADRWGALMAGKHVIPVIQTVGYESEL